MVVTGRRVREHVVDEPAALLLEDLAEAVLLGLEELVERGLRDPRKGDDVVDRGDRVAARGEERQGSLGDPTPPLLDPRVPAQLGRRKRHRDQLAARAREMTRRWISLVPSNSV